MYKKGRTGGGKQKIVTIFNNIDNVHALGPSK